MTIIDKYLMQFEAYFNGDLSATEKVDFEGLLDHDSDMRFAWVEYRSMMEAFADKEAILLRLMLNKVYDSHRSGKQIKYLSSSLWIRLSAAAVIVIIMGGLLYFFCSTSPVLSLFNEPGVSLVSDSVNIDQEIFIEDSLVNINHQSPGVNLKDVSEPNLVASIFDKEEYQIAPAFAELLHNVYRSNWFGLITPEDSVQFSVGDSLVFSWETNIQEQIYFDILDRHGVVVYRNSQPIISPWSFSPNLPPAIYMFRFSTEDQPVWMGVMVGIEG